MIVYGATTDNTTQDPSLQFARPVSSGSDPSRTIAAVAAAPGVLDSLFRTTLQLHNPTSSPISGRLVFHPGGFSGSDSDPTITYALSAGATTSYARRAGSVRTDRVGKSRHRGGDRRDVRSRSRASSTTAAFAGRPVFRSMRPVPRTRCRRADRGAHRAGRSRRRRGSTSGSGPSPRARRCRSRSGTGTERRSAPSRRFTRRVTSSNRPGACSWALLPGRANPWRSP